jgi:hypothetical protein
MELHEEETERILSRAKLHGWGRQVEMNEKVADNLRNIIKTLQDKAQTKSESF